jgi:secreted Zn-dependent insulinase-like peptidase
MEQKNDFSEIAEALRRNLDEMLGGLINEPVRQAVDQIPGILGRQDWTVEQKHEAVKELQLALVAPFVGAAVNAAQGSQMDLGLFLFYTGQAWEEVRSQQMAHIAEEMLNPNKEGNEDGTGEG